MAKTKAAESKVTAAAKKYMKPSEVATFGIGLFGVALLTGWMPDYTTTSLPTSHLREKVLTLLLFHTL